MSIFKFNFDKTTAFKSKESIPKQVQNAIKVITLDYDNVIMYGSWAYKSQQYPGDIDLLEEDYECCDREGNIKSFVKHFQKIVKRIMSTPGYYLGDIKAGIDHDYEIKIGKLDYDKKGNPIITGYYPDVVNRKLDFLYNDSILPETDYLKIQSLVKKEMSATDFEDLYDALRKKWLLRWTGKEVLQGYKILDGGRKKTLAEAIQDYTLTKIDMWHNILGRFIEITDVYIFYSRNEDGTIVNLNFDKPLPKIVEELKLEVQKYAFSKKYYKPFKLVKRMWVISRLAGDENIVKILTPFMQTDVGRLNQVGAEIETILNILEKVKNPPMKEIISQIDGFKWRLSNVYQINWDEQKVDIMLDKITSSKKIPIIIEGLEEVQHYIKELVRDNTTEFLKENKLLPPPVNYLP